MVTIKEKEIGKLLNESEQIKKINEEYIRKKLNLNVLKITKLHKDLNIEISRIKK